MTVPGLPAPTDLVPGWAPGLVHLGVNAALLAAGLALAMTGGWLPYAAGQLLLTLGFLQAFVLLHEAGHQTLLPNRAANRIAGHAAGFVALIPFVPWQHVHARHHRWTGWQDLDATTASLVPRTLRPFERFAVNFAWRTGLPLFSLVYRVQNYWNLPRIERFVREPSVRAAMRRNVLAAGAATFAFVALAGPLDLALLCGPALLLSWMAQDLLLLSQHTHMPLKLSGGRPVRAFRPPEQGPFTRSLRLPRGLSWLLLHFDAHEAHHRWPRVPGYRLRRIAWQAPNEVPWLAWIRAAKRLRGEDFLFRNRLDTGAAV